MYKELSEDFSTDYEKTKKALEGVSFEVQQKKTLLAQGKPLSSIDASIREKLRKIEASLKSFNGTLKDWEMNPEFYNLTDREVERRRNKIQELTNLYQDMKTKAFESDNPSLSKERERLFKEGQMTGTTTQTNKKLTVEETMANQKKALKNQDEQIDTLLTGVQNIKVIGQNIGTEINDQNVILEDLNKNIDRNVVQMEKTSTKFTRILENSSTWKLFLAIGIEIAILVIIIIFA